jgi:hypothetical protein
VEIVNGELIAYIRATPQRGKLRGRTKDMAKKSLKKSKKLESAKTLTSR